MTYKETLPVVEASGVPLLPFANTAKTWLFDWITGEVQEAPLSPPELFLLVQEDTQRYTVFWNNIFSPKMTNIGYKVFGLYCNQCRLKLNTSQNGIPEEYTVPFLQWLSANNLTSLQPIFEAGMVPYGYGDITETPAVGVFSPLVHVWEIDVDPGCRFTCFNTSHQIYCTFSLVSMTATL